MGLKALLVYWIPCCSVYYGSCLYIAELWVCLEVLASIQNPSGMLVWEQSESQQFCSLQRGGGAKRRDAGQECTLGNPLFTSTRVCHYRCKYITASVLVMSLHCFITLRPPGSPCPCKPFLGSPGLSVPS